MDFIDQRIATIRAEITKESSSRDWTIHCDRVRQREKKGNYDAIVNEVKAGVNKIREGLNRSIELTEDPAWYFTVRDPSPTGATVTVTMSHDGAVVEIRTQRHLSANGPFPESTIAVRVEVQDDGEIFYKYERRMTANGVGNLILAPFL